MNKVFLILTSGDVVVHQEASFPYAINAKKLKWMDEVRVILWGPTEKIAAEDKNFQEYVLALLNAGVEVIACKACSDNFGVSDKLEELGIDVKYVGTLVTEMLKEGWHQLTF
ncbi:MAG: DsrE family protein [Candidatus Heimdallarchaeum aukensis]|uniref:DsrE family protein n=1 Tax=Candidatus Heimdallarchaeum aukensis TaxID=2876573 RepID=A0A9Y1BM15_9ARCH|nr:MAG: DsrE family protein [Candidatus Heimdallarchaeum aukensis]